LLPRGPWALLQLAVALAVLRVELVTTALLPAQDLPPASTLASVPPVALHPVNTFLALLALAMSLATTTAQV
jgi:hypothetical protein